MAGEQDMMKNKSDNLSRQLKQLYLEIWMWKKLHVRTLVEMGEEGSWLCLKAEMNSFQTWPEAGVSVLVVWQLQLGDEKSQPVSRK